MDHSLRCSVEQVSVNMTFGYPSYLGGNALAAKVMVSRARGGETILAVWEHLNIRPLVEAMGVPAASVPSWPDSDYDTVYALEIDSGTGEVISFHIEHENFTAPDIGLRRLRQRRPPGW